MELFAILLFPVVLAAFAALSAEIGVDSRDFSDDPHRSNYPVSIA